MPTKHLFHLKNNLLIIFAMLLLFLHFSLGCSVRKRELSTPPTQNQNTPPVAQPETKPLYFDPAPNFNSSCEASTRWNQFWCTLKWSPYEAQLVFQDQVIEGIAGQYQVLIDGGAEFQLKDLEGKVLYSFSTPIDLAISKNLSAEELQKILNSRFAIHELRLEGPLTINTLGVDLKVKVNSLVIQNQVQFLSFPPDSKAQKVGRSSGSLSIVADQILGDTLIINANGENGGDGQDGYDLSHLSGDNGKNGGFCYLDRPIKLEGRASAPNITTCKCTMQVPINNQAIYVTRYVADSLFPTSGKDGRSGGVGSPGFDGGNAGLVKIQTNHSSLLNLEISSRGGHGGKGGFGGKGERGGTKGQFDAISECAPENFKWPLNGKDGPRGSNGNQGQNGNSSLPVTVGVIPTNLNSAPIIKQKN